MNRLHIQIIFLLAVFCNTLSSQGFVIKNLVVDIQMQKNGNLDVSEKYDVYFYEKKRGIFRAIPYEFETESGGKIKTDLSNISVPNHQENISRKNGIATIRIGSPNKYITGDQKYEIRYQVARPYLRYEDRTELIWNIAAHNWPTEVQNFSYNFTMPDDLIMPDADMVILSSKINENDLSIASIQKVGKIISGEASRPLAAGEGITLALNLPKDYIVYDKKNDIQNTGTPDSNSQDTLAKEPSKKDNGYWIVGIIGALYGWFYKKFGRNTHVSEIKETYYPPEGMPAPEVGTFYDFRANTRDLICLLPKWGQEGLIEINSLEKKDDKRDLYFDKKKDLPNAAPAYEKTMFDGLFQDNTQVFLTDLQEKYYTVLSKAKSEVKKEILDERLFDQTAKKYFHSIWNVVSGILLILFAILTMIKFQAFLSGVLLIILGIIVITIKFLRPKLSDEGQELHNRMEALHLFLKNPEPQMINELMDENPKYLDFIFPYVVAFGLDKSWNEAMSKSSYIDYSPPWYMYHNPGGHISKSTYSDFSANFNVPKIQSVFSSAPASTTGTGGGFSGGGSSGGGFGGGGGGSW